MIKTLLQHETVKFILVGIINTVFGYIVFASLIALGLHYTLAIFLGTCLGIIFNFHTFGRLVFNNQKYNLLYKFIITYGIIYIVNISVVKWLLSLGLNIYLAGFLSTILMAGLSYTLNKLWVFRK